MTDEHATRINFLKVSKKQALDMFNPVKAQFCKQCKQEVGPHSVYFVKDDGPYCQNCVLVEYRQ